MASRAGVAELPFDGIICIGGEDWWYHNRGHFDFQILRRLGRNRPVLFVNSIGVRFPSLAGGKAVFGQRMARKLKSLSRGLVHIENQFHVFSPVLVPGKAGRAASGWALAPQIRLAAARLGMKKPLFWAHCPPAADLIGKLGEVAMVMQRTDRFEAFPEGDGVELSGLIRKLKDRADLVIYCNEDLRQSEVGEVRRSALITHGVELDRFIAAGRATGEEPADIAEIPHPRVLFVGGIDHHTFDPPLFAKMAAAMPDVNFVLVGGSSLPADWCPLANVFPAWPQALRTG